MKIALSLRSIMPDRACRPISAVPPSPAKPQRGSPQDPVPSHRARMPLIAAGRTGEGRNHAVDIHGHMRIDKGNRRHAVRRNHRDRTLTQHLQRQADRQGRAAAGTGLMAIKEFLICHRLCVKRHKYPSSDSQSWPRQPWQSRPEAPHRSSQCRSCRCCGRPDRRRSSPRESPRPRSSARS